MQGKCSLAQCTQPALGVFASSWPPSSSSDALECHHALSADVGYHGADCGLRLHLTAVLMPPCCVAALSAFANVAGRFIIVICCRAYAASVDRPTQLVFLYMVRCIYDVIMWGSTCTPLCRTYTVRRAASFEAAAACSQSSQVTMGLYSPRLCLPAHCVPSSVVISHQCCWWQCYKHTNNMLLCNHATRQVA